MTEVGNLKVNLSADAGAFTASLAEAIQALDDFAAAAERANAALTKLSAGHRISVTIDNAVSERGEEVKRAVEEAQRNIARGARATDHRFKL